MPKALEERRCHECGQRTLRRVQRPYEYEVSHDGRPPVLIRIPDLRVIACTNPDCHPDDPGETELLDDAALRRIGDETSRQLGLLTPAEIRENRERLGLNQQELQELLGLGGNSLSRWENGRVYQSRSMDTFLRVIFGVPEAREFLTLAGEKPVHFVMPDREPGFVYLESSLSKAVGVIDIRNRPDPSQFLFDIAA